jgi:hypothetical protein
MTMEFDRKVRPSFELETYVVNDVFECHVMACIPGSTSWLAIR